MFHSWHQSGFQQLFLHCMGKVGFFKKVNLRNILLFIGFVKIGHVRYINIQAWLRGFRVKIANFSSSLCPSIPKRDFDTKKTAPNIDVRPESLGAMLEYWYTERGLLEIKKWFSSTKTKFVRGLASLDCWLILLDNFFSGSVSKRNGFIFLLPASRTCSMPRYNEYFDLSLAVSNQSALWANSWSEQTN